MALRLALICHAPTAATRTATFPADEPLDGPGLERARAAAHRFSNTARYLRSPALAAQQTAEALDLPAGIEPELRECDYGCWVGRSINEVQTDDPEGAAQWLSNPSNCPHGGESMLALLRRVSTWLGTHDQSGQVVAITHASIVRAAIVAALDAPPRAFWRIDVSPLSVTWLHRGVEPWTLSSANQRLRPPRNQRLSN
jgi:broad specificity phosphatase PhoE